MPIHYKIDLLTDEALAADATEVGDIIFLDVPFGETVTPGNHEVLAIERTDAGVNEGTHYTRQILTLKDADENPTALPPPVGA
jgi:hypothetical protein